MMPDTAGWTANDWADMYRNEWGINVVPSNGCQRFKGGDIPAANRPPRYRQYYDEPVPQEQHDLWKKDGAFDAGIMKLTGTVWHREDKRDMLYCSIDCDNRLAVEEIIGDDPLKMSENHCIEMHLDDSDRCHWDFYVKKDSGLKGKAGDGAGGPDAGSRPAFEVKVGGGLMFGCPSIHKGGHRYEYLGKNVPGVMDGAKIQDRMKELAVRYGLAPKKEGVAGLTEPGAVIPEGHNRQLGILRFVESMFRRTEDLQLPESYYDEQAFWFAKNHTEEGYSDAVISQKAKSAVSYMRGIIRSEKNEKYADFVRGRLKDGLHEDATWLIKYMITDLKVASRIDIKNRIMRWYDLLQITAADSEKDNPLYRFGASRSDVRMIIDGIFDTSAVFERLRETAREYARLEVQVYFDADQHVELAAYITERWHVKKLGLDGQLVHFGGRCYTYTRGFLERQVQLLTSRIRSDTVRETVRYVEHYAPVLDEAAFEKNRHLIVMNNGVYDIVNNRFVPEFSPAHMVMRMIPHNYDPEADAGDCDRILGAITGADYPVFRDFLSICLYPDIGIYMMYVQLSSPGTGKTQISEFVHNLLGSANIEHFSVHDIAGDATNRIACARALLNVDEDMSDMDIGDVAYLLKWITMDTVSSRSIYSQPVKFAPSSRLMANTNVLFSVAKESHMQALNDRTHTAVLRRRFRHTKDDVPDIVKNTLKPENYDRYITEILHNAHRLYVTKKIECRNSAATENGIWNEFGNWIRKFCASWIENRTGEKVRDKDLWLKWNDYASENGVMRGSQSTFYSAVGEITGIKRGSIRIDDYISRGYNGLRLRRDDELGVLEGPD